MCLGCKKNSATTFCLGCGRQTFCDLCCQNFSRDGKEVNGYGPPGSLPVGYRDRNGRGRAGHPGNILMLEDVERRGGFPSRNPRDLEFGPRRGFGGPMHRGYDDQFPENVVGRDPRRYRGRMPEDFIGRVPRDFEGE
jgi:hypothetical protein